MRAMQAPQPDPIVCPRCELPLSFAGTRDFHEGTRWGVFGDLGELFVNKDHYDIYVCMRCGRAEFFIDGIGEELRPQPSA